MFPARRSRPSTRLAPLLGALLLIVAAPATALAGGGSRRDEGYFDAGLHGFLVQGKTMLGMQIGGGYGAVAGQFEIGLIYNDKHLERYDTTYLGPYFGMFLYGFVHRSRDLDVKIGIGGELLSAAEVATSLDFGALVLSAVAHYNVSPHVSIFVRGDALPVRSHGLVVRTTPGGLPLMARAGLEWTSAD